MSGRTDSLPVWVLCAMAVAGRAADTLPLDGEWRFRLDREDAGVTGAWHGTPLPGRIRLPGTLAAQGIGDPVGTNTPWTGSIIDRSFFTDPAHEKDRLPGCVRIPFWLTPDSYYAGAAWYQREVSIPEAWRGKRVTLTLERPHWETRVWLGNRPFGPQNSLSAPHEYDFGLVEPGRHVLTIRVDNRMILMIGENSHSVSDHTQGNWNGMVGRIEMRATPPVWIDNIQVYPGTVPLTARIAVRLGNCTGTAGTGLLSASVSGPASAGESVTRAPVVWDASGGRAEFEVTLLPGSAWDEFEPRLRRLTVSLDKAGDSGGAGDRRTVTFGLRDFAARGTRFTLNGRPLFLRGTLDCCAYPRTGHPPMDLAEWKRIIGVVKAHGLNLIRFHSWCPPEAAFAAADELGCYLHVEVPLWANNSAKLGDGDPVDAWIHEETERILDAYGNHPSFVLMACGNEPGGKHQKSYLAQWVLRHKSRDPRRLFTSAAGWPELPENQWHCLPGPRIQGWGEGLKSVINAQPPSTAFDYRAFIDKRDAPVVSHEIGQWCAYPNFAEIVKYTGYLKPRNFEIFRDRLAARGLAEQARDFLAASGKLQALCYKADIEAALRTPGMAGFELLGLSDFPGQGTATVGVLDPFWEGKGYITPDAYRRFCNATVPLARLSRRVFTTADTLEADLEVAHFGPRPLADATIAWSLQDDRGIPAAHGTLPPRTIPFGNGHAIGRIRVPLNAPPVRAPARYRLTVNIRGTPFENDWGVWVYPEQPELPSLSGVTIAHGWDASAQAALQAGGRVLLLLPPSRVRNFPDPRNRVTPGFSSIFWNTAWTRRQPPTTLGILCDPAHPALARFPTDFHSDWQWWHLITRAAPMILDDLPHGVRPIIQVIDDWVTAHKLALVIEGRVGKGRLLVCSVDLSADAGKNPVARQFRASLLAYVAGEAFRPAAALTAADIALLSETPTE